MNKSGPSNPGSTRKRTRKRPKAGVSAQATGVTSPVAPAAATVPPDTAATMLDAARATVLRAMHALDDCIERVGAMLAGEYDAKIASHLAYLTKHAIMTLSEVRKLEAHDQRAVQAMEPAERDELIRLYVAQMPADRRASIRQVIDDCDARDRSILAPRAGSA